MAADRRVSGLKLSHPPNRQNTVKAPLRVQCHEVKCHCEQVTQSLVWQSPAFYKVGDSHDQCKHWSQNDKVS